MSVIQKALDTLHRNMMQFGYILSTSKDQEALKGMARFVVYKNRILVVLLHVPIYKTQSALFTYRYESKPNITKHNERDPSNKTQERNLGSYYRF